MRKTYIYGLQDPRDKKIYYIGKSNNPSARLKRHLDDMGVNGLKEDWLAGLRSCGLVPDIVILEETTMQDWQARERDWIASGIASG